MALDERFILGAPLDQYFVDKDTGEPLSNGQIYFYRDEARAELKTVYQITGTPPNYSYTALPNPITLNGSGQIVNASNQNVALYYFPFDGTPDNSTGEVDLYYVAAFNSGAIAQWTREGWPNITAGNNPLNDAFPVQNQITNPQFTNVFINEGFSTTFTVAAATQQVFNLAPDWDLVISGSGDVMVQRIAVAGNSIVPTNPPYVLDITVTANITECLLRQRMNVNSGLWSSTNGVDVYLSGTILIRNENLGTAGIQLIYEESSGGSPIDIINQSFSNDYVELMGATSNPIPASTNSDSGNSGYVDIYLSIQPNSHIRVSSIQVVPTLSQSGSDMLPYDRQTSNREQALQGDYFIPALNQREAEPLLVGWDFTKNPFQFRASGTMLEAGGTPAANAYMCDQTIGISRSAGSITYARNAITNGLELTTTDTNDSFYLLQYLTGAEVKRILGTKLSCNVWGWHDAASTAPTMRVYLYRATAAASVPSLATTIGTIAADGVFTLTAANWTEIPRGGLDTAKATMNDLSANNQINNSTFDYGFSQWQITDSTQIGDTDKFAIVTTFSYVESGTIITINDINVTTNPIPSRTPVKTFEQTLRDCEYYYEKSYANNQYAGSASTANAISRIQNTWALGGTIFSGASVFGVEYQTIKRTNPALEIRTPGSGGAADSVFVGIRAGATTLASNNVSLSTFWTALNANTKSFAYYSNSATSTQSAASGATNFSGFLEFHYIADARLGIV